MWRPYRGEVGASIPQHRGDAAGFVELLSGIPIDDLDPAAHLDDRLAEVVGGIVDIYSIN